MFKLTNITKLIQQNTQTLIKLVMAAFISMKIILTCSILHQNKKPRSAQRGSETNQFTILGFNKCRQRHRVNFLGIKLCESLQIEIFKCMSHPRGIVRVKFYPASFKLIPTGRYGDQLLIRTRSQHFLRSSSDQITFFRDIE